MTTVMGSLRASIVPADRLDHIAEVVSVALHEALDEMPCHLHRCAMCVTAMVQIVDNVEPHVVDALLEELAINVGRASVPKGFA